MFYKELEVTNEHLRYIGKFGKPNSIFQLICWKLHYDFGCLCFPIFSNKKGYEPLLLVPIAFGMLLVNMYPDIIKAPVGDEAGGLLHYFYILDEWSILPSLIFMGVWCND